VTRHARGKSYRRWEKIKPSARNEALDIRVYAMAARAILNPNLRLIARRTRAAAIAAREATVETPAVTTPAIEEVQTSALEEQTPEEQTASPAPRRKLRRRGQKNFATNWR
jgi:phage terminase large subunit GpA-like protein